MEQRRLGQTGLKISRFGLGTWSWGRDTDEYEARDQLAAFVDAGGTLLDTAPSYGAGASEGLVGELLRDTVSRDDVVIATKGGITGSGRTRVRDTSRGAMLRSLDASLARLGIDDVDLWQVHLWVDHVPPEETLAALDAAVTSGRARYIGISNYSGWQTAQAATWQRAWPGRSPLASTQVEYSLLNRGVEREVVPAAEAHGLGVLAWSPLGRGVLSGKYRTGTPADSRAASAHYEAFVEPYLDAESAQIVEAVAKAADGLGLSPVEVALAWLRDRPGVTAPLLGARTAAQLRGALTAEDVLLPPEIVEALDDVSAIDMGYPER
ncbi:MAG: aldo/keto reductase [Propionibacteriales bacterium]|nr:aldo/keto reductase [Propionibacteriales bacterium]